MRRKKVQYTWSQMLRFPEPGEAIRVIQHGRVLVTGLVIAADDVTVTVSTDGQKLVDLDSFAISDGIRDGSIRIERVGG